MKKKTIKRKLKLLFRMQREMLDMDALVMRAVLDLQDAVADFNDDGPGESAPVEAGQPKLKVVG